VFIEARPPSRIRREYSSFLTDLRLARTTFAAAVKRWPGAKITLRNGARIIEKTWPVDD
jgi:hypothetical protein